LAAFSSTGPIQEHGEARRVASEVTGAVWTALDLSEICPREPEFPLLSQTPEAIRQWQLENKRWCERAEPIHDPNWIAARFQERYAAVRQLVLRLPFIDVDALMKQLCHGHDAAVERWIRLTADRSALTRSPDSPRPRNQSRGKREERPYVTKRDKATEARNKWIYEQCYKGIPYDTIVIRLKKKPKSWDRIDSKQGILACARKYAERHSLPPPPPRQGRE